MKPVLPWPAALFSSLLIALSGNMMWFALSGMETVLFLAIGIFALLIYRTERWVLLGILLGLLVLTRPEGVALVIALCIVDIWREKTFGTGIFICMLVCGLICIPWYVYIFIRTEHILPTSAVAKIDNFKIGMEYISKKNHVMKLLYQFYPSIYFGLLAAFIFEFVLGGIVLPGPSISFDAVAHIPGYNISYFAIFLFLLIILPLIAFAFQRIIEINKWTIWIKDESRKVLLGLILWVLIHNLLLAIGLPSVGTAGRYTALTIVAFWILVITGLNGIKHQRVMLIIAIFGLAIIGFFNIKYWNDVNDSNIEYMESVRIPAANFICNNFSKLETCAAVDIGVFRYFCDRPILDLGGLIDSSLINYFRSGDLDIYLIKNHATCLALPGNSRNMENTIYNFLELLGITNSEFIEFQPIKMFSMNIHRWLIGSIPTNNYPSELTIYRVLSVNYDEEITSVVGQLTSFK